MPQPSRTTPTLEQLKALQQLSQQPECIWQANLDLETITPIIGGGVDAKQPDEVDIIRVRGIRGQLRWWWRVLYQTKGETPDQLFRRESRLWGGVGVEGLPGQQTALRSRVHLRVRVTKAGQSVPAGRHEEGRNGQIKPMPRWLVGKLGYGLFPLMRSKPERDANRGARNLDTLPVRGPTRFNLQVTVCGKETRQCPSNDDVAEVAHTIWAWIHLGGIGGRTRRGFGALELQATPTFKLQGKRLSLPKPFNQGSIENGLLHLRTHSSRNCTQLHRWPPVQCLLGPKVGRMHNHKGGHGHSHRPTRGSNQLLNSGQAHELALGHLGEFRQGPGVGRDPATRKRPGRSRWPEPNLLRLTADPDAAWDHPPPPEVREKAADLGAPRAEFGLPLIIKFKSQDNVDTSANATLLPEGSQSRWASPILLRPVRDGSGHRPLVLILADPDAPKNVRIEFDSNSVETVIAPIQRAEGSREVIHDHLQSADGSSLKAFAKWLKDKNGFEEINS